MDFENILLFPAAICGPVFIAVGFIMLKFPPKKINNFYGYRTENSMKSQERWDFSQQYSAKEMMKWGGFLSLTSLLGFVLEGKTATFVGIGLLFLFIIILVVRTESAIKRNFDKI